MSKYSEKLRDPRWQQMRLRVFERDGWRCLRCLKKEETLMVHHRRYERGKEPWEYDLADLATLCESCHWEEHHDRQGCEAFFLSAAKRKGILGAMLADFAVSIEQADFGADHEIAFRALGWALENAEVRARLIREYVGSVRKQDAKAAE